MNKTAVIYKSKYGSTKEYANWIAEELGGKLFDVSEITAQKLEDYNTVIFVGRIHAGSIQGLSGIKKIYNELSGKKIIIFAVGATGNDEKIKTELVSRNFLESMKNSPLFLLQGRLDYKTMTAFDRLLMFGLVKYFKSKKPEELGDQYDAAKQIIETYGKIVDFVDKNSINPIIQAATQ